MKTTASIDAARLELLLTELRLPAVKLMWKKLAARRHAVMGAQFLVAPRQVVLGVAIEVTERRRQAVAAVLFRHPAQRPQRVLQAFGERHEALAAEHHMGMRKAREGKPEVIEPAQQRRARDGDAKGAHVGEVRQAHPARRVFLAEHHIAAGAGGAHGAWSFAMATADRLRSDTRWRWKTPPSRPQPKRSVSQFTSLRPMPANT